MSGQLPNAKMFPEKRVSRWVLFVILLISSFWLYQLRDLRFDYDLERFFPAHDPETAFFQEFRDRFGTDNTYVLIGLQPQSGVFDPAFLLQLDSLTRQLETVPGAERVFSPTNLRYQVRNTNPFGPRMISTPFLHVKDPARLVSDSLHIFRQEGWVRSFFGEDRRSVALQLWHGPMPTDADCAALADTVRQLVNGLNIQESAVAGKCFGETTFIETLRRETVLFTGSSLLAVLFLLALTYRTVQGVVLPLLVVGLSVSWTVGMMAWNDQPIDLISNIIPTILLVIGIADAIHLITHYQLFRRLGMPLSTALRRAFREVGAATLLTTLTTAVGFLTLTTSTFQPLVEMGWAATAGLFFALLLTYTLIPAIIVLQGDIFRGFSDAGSWWVRRMLLLLGWVRQNQNWILFFSAVVLFLSPIGILQLRINNFLLEDLRQGHPRRQAFRFFETHFSGARGLELALISPDSTSELLSLENLRLIGRLDSLVKRDFEAGRVVSPAELVKQAHQIARGGEPSAYRLPDRPAELDLLVQRLRSEAGSELWGKYVSHRDGETWIRINALVKDEGSAVFWKRYQHLRAWAEEVFRESPFQLRITGTPYLLDLNNRYLVSNVIKGLAIAIALVGVLFALVLGSVRLGLLSLIPNLLPLILVAGLMGGLNIDLKISTSIIFIISFGIAVDDSIHFLTRFKREMEARVSVSSALRHTMVSSGKAIVLTTLILMCGFMTLSFSSFLGTFYLGLLVSVTLLLAGLFDLTLLPVLLYLFYRRTKK